MKKYFVALASTVLITSAFAQTSSAPSSTVAANAAPTMTKSADKGDAKREANNEKHIKDLHAKLHITSSQESLWSPVAATMRSNSSEVDQVVDKREASIGTASAIDDLNSYAEIVQAHADSVKKLALAFAPLYAAMPDAQKKIADGVFTQRGVDKKIAAAK